MVSLGTSLMLSVLTPGPPMYSTPPRDISVSRPHLGSYHGVSDPLVHFAWSLFSSDFWMEQHQWTSKPITEMAPRYDHDHVRLVDRILDLVRRRHLSRPRPHAVHWHSRFADLAADVQHHSSCQRQYSTVQNTSIVPFYIIHEHLSQTDPSLGIWFSILLPTVLLSGGPGSCVLTSERAS